MSPTVDEISLFLSKDYFSSPYWIWTFSRIHCSSNSQVSPYIIKFCLIIKSFPSVQKIYYEMYFLLYKQKYTQKLFLILFLASFHSFSASLAANILENILYILFFQFPLPSFSHPTTPTKLLSTWLSMTLMQLQPMLVSWLHFIWPKDRNRHSWSFFPPWYIVFQWISKAHHFLGCISTLIIILTQFI